MGSQDHSRRWWFAAAGAIVVVASAGLAMLVWFFIQQGRENADQWASILAVLLTYTVVCASVVIWIIRRARGSAPAENHQKSPVFNVTAARDAYTAQQMTIEQRDAEQKPDEQSTSS